MHGETVTLVLTCRGRFQCSDGDEHNDNDLLRCDVIVWQIFTDVSETPAASSVTRLGLCN